VDEAVRQRRRRFGKDAELARPVETLARAQGGLTVLDPKLQAIAVELHLVRPARARRRALDQLAELRGNELGQARDLARLRRLGLLRVLLAAALAVPHRARGAFVLPAHERRRRLAGPQLDFLQGPAR